jgi:hypothetical protein
MSDINQEIPTGEEVAEVIAAPVAPKGNDIFSGEPAPDHITPKEHVKAEKEHEAAVAPVEPVVAPVVEPTAPLTANEKNKAIHTPAVEPVKEVAPVQPVVKEAVAPKATPALSAEEIATLAAQTVVQTQAAQAKAAEDAKPAPKMSDADFNKKFNVFSPTEEHVEAILQGGEEAVAALQEIVAGVALQATTQANFASQQSLAQHQQNLAPYISLAEAEQSKQLADKFYLDNPQLNGQDALVASVIGLPEVQALSKQGVTQADIFKVVADKATAMITQIRDGAAPVVQVTGGQPAAVTQPLTTSQPQVAGSKMPGTSTGGQGGAGGTGGSAKAVPGPKGNAVFG